MRMINGLMFTHRLKFVAGSLHQRIINNSLNLTNDTCILSRAVSTMYMAGHEAKMRMKLLTLSTVTLFD
jgi:hypothetical protein